MEDLVMLDSRFWIGKRVLVTGHTGFKGGWLCLWLQELGASVHGFSLAPSTQPSLFDVAHVAERMDSRIGDIRDLGAISQAIAAVRPEIVIHMAAQPLVRRSYADPVGTYATNVMGTVHLLESIRRVGSPRVVINVTSDKCYENREWVWGYREIDPLGGYDPYSNSKACSELVTNAYRSSYLLTAGEDGHGTAVATARAGNVIGGGDWSEDRLIPDLVRACTDGVQATIRNPGAIRPWQHVLEPLAGYMLLAEKVWSNGRSYSEAWNFGPSEEDARSVQWVATRFVSLWGEGALRSEGSESDPHEASYLRLDSAKARARLKWVPRWDLEVAIRKTVEWYKSWQSSRDPREISVEQIRDYSQVSGR